MQHCTKQMFGKELLLKTRTGKCYITWIDVEEYVFQIRNLSVVRLCPLLCNRRKVHTNGINADLP